MDRRSNFFDRKKKYMNARFGILKGFILRKRQFISMRYTLDYFITSNTNAITVEEKRKFACDLYDYLHTTRDIWDGSPRLCAMIRAKLMDFYSQESVMFQKYMVLFGYLCPYRKRKGDFCNRPVGTHQLCNQHKKCLQRRSTRIADVLSWLPVCICEIVDRYAMCL